MPDLRRWRAGAPLLWGWLMCAMGSAQDPRTDGSQTGAPTPAAVPFALGDVRLLDGPFQQAMERNARYLLELEPDRLLSRVREYAGLPPKAPHYGGWEAESIATHSLGHYLSACALQFAATGDERFRQRVDEIVDELAACQAAHGDGYAAGIPRGREIFAEVGAGDIRSRGFDLNGGWVPWYTTHKILAGLRDAHLHAGSTRARDVLTRFADYCWSVIDDLDDAQMQRMLACEHGGMNEVSADVFALTGDPRYLRMAQAFYHRAVLDPLTRQEDRLAGLHANTQVPKLIGLARLYELTGDERFATAARFFWDRVVHHYTYVNGGNSYNESFGPPDQQVGRLQDTTETCNTYNMLKLTRHLFGWAPRAELMDYYERALLNHILAHQHAKTGMYVYKGFLSPETRKQFSTPFDSFWCCVGTGMENHVKYGESIYFHTDDALYVNLFIASRLTWKERGLTLTQRTEWPFGAQSRLEIGAERPTELALRVRRPYWATGGVSIAINGEPVTVNAGPGEYVELRRTWSDGDLVALEFPMALRTESMPDDENCIALFYGPTLLAAVLEDGQETPALVGERASLLEKIRPLDAAKLTFASEGLGRPRELRLMPLFAITDERYSVYLDCFDEARWKAREAERAAERAALAALEARTVDFFLPGQMQPERDHKLTGEKTYNGTHNGRTWRDARDGGWFSFEMRVDPQAPMTLVCTYWGDDSGPRNFDILVDGEKIATQSLNRLKPNRFVDVAYEVPPALTRDKAQVTVRLTAHPGQIAGGIFGCRTVRSDAVGE